MAARVSSIGDGQVRFYQACRTPFTEHHQLEKFLDADYLEESGTGAFDRIVEVFASATTPPTACARWPTLPGHPRGTSTRPMIFLEDRRKALLERQQINRDSRLVADLLAAQADVNSGDPAIKDEKAESSLRYAHASQVAAHRAARDPAATLALDVRPAREGISSRKSTAKTTTGSRSRSSHAISRRYRSLEDRRNALLERQLINRDSRLVADLLAAQAGINSGENGDLPLRSAREGISSRRSTHWMTSRRGHCLTRSRHHRRSGTNRTRPVTMGVMMRPSPIFQPGRPSPIRNAGRRRSGFAPSTSTWHSTARVRRRGPRRW